MKKFLQSIAVLAVFSVACELYAQTDENGKLPPGTTAAVRKYPVVKSKVVSLGGTATATKATAGRGVLVGVDLVGVDSTGTPAVMPFSVAFYDVATTNNIIAGNGALLTQKKIIADVSSRDYKASSGGPTHSSGSAFIRYDNPVTFDKGIVIYNNSTATAGQVAVYWIE